MEPIESTEPMESMESMQDAFSALSRAMDIHARVSAMPMDFGVGRKLLPDEIHAIAAVDPEHGTPVRDLAQALGKVPEDTESLAARLRDFGLLEKDALHDDTMRLTATGLIAQEAHFAFHIERDKHFLAYIASLDEEGFSRFRETCRQLERWMESYLD